MYLISFHPRAPLCTPQGLECYQSVYVDAKECLAECKGLYADVDRKGDFKQIEQIENVGEIIAKYEEYRRGFQEDIEKYYNDFGLSSKFSVLLIVCF